MRGNGSNFGRGSGGRKRGNKAMKGISLVNLVEHNMFLWHQTID